MVTLLGPKYTGPWVAGKSQELPDNPTNQHLSAIVGGKNPYSVQSCFDDKLFGNKLKCNSMIFESQVFGLSEN
jgi:hypothetical protein